MPEVTAVARHRKVIAAMFLPMRAVCGDRRCAADAESFGAARVEVPARRIDGLWLIPGSFVRR